MSPNISISAATPSARAARVGCFVAVLLAVAYVISGPAADRDRAMLVSWMMPEKAAAAEVGAADGKAIPGLHLIRESPLRTSPYSIVWSKNGKRLAACSFSCNDITIWNEQGDVEGRLTRPGAFYVGNGLGFLNDDRWLIAPPRNDNATDVLASVFDIASGNVVREIAGPEPGATFGNKAYLIAVSPDESVVAAVAGSDVSKVEPVRLYSAPDLSLLAVLTGSAAPPVEGVTCLAFSPDSKLLAIGRVDGSVVVYDVASREIVTTVDAFRKYRQPVKSVATSSDHQFVAVGGTLGGGQWRNPDGSPAPARNQGQLSAPEGINVYRILDGAKVASDTNPMAAVVSTAWRAQGNLIAFVTFDHLLHIWDPWHAGAQEEIVQLRYDALSVAISPDGSRIAAGGGGRLLLFGFGN